MPDNDSAIFTYTEWTQDMINLYNKYSMVRELNQELMRKYPAYAMYTISEYLKRKRIDAEIALVELGKESFAKAGNNIDAIVSALEESEKNTYAVLRPIIEDYVKVRTYYYRDCRNNSSKEIENEEQVKRAM